MKKITFMMLGMAAMLAVSCGEKKETAKEGEAPATEATTETSAPAEAAPATEAATGDAATFDKYISLMEKFVDAAAKKDQAQMQSLGMEIATLAQDFAKVDQTKLTKEQVEKLTEISKKYQEAVMPK
ncbi:MAG: hypothetical protein LBE34_06310 [Flavobacteriaceae bacterium]|jgi:cob(I)alamin adenosyltransferase|nr:hypothetical protein [Flavobacteriaceae bacterium]